MLVELGAPIQNDMFSILNYFVLRLGGSTKKMKWRNRQHKIYILENKIQKFEKASRIRCSHTKRHVFNTKSFCATVREQHKTNGMAESSAQNVYIRTQYSELWKIYWNLELPYKWHIFSTKTFCARLREQHKTREFQHKTQRRQAHYPRLI